MASLYLASCAEHDQDREVVSQQSAELKVAASLAKSWAAELRAPDAAKRKAAVQAAVVVGAPDAAMQLEQVIAEDPSVDVREHAVLAYAEVSQALGIPFLRKLALSSKQPQLVDAAHSCLHDLRALTPPRGFLNVEFPSTFAAGVPFPLKLRFGSSSSVKQAHVAVGLPPALQTKDGKAARWSGALPSGVERELTILVVADGTPAKAGAHVTLKLQYAEELDFEVYERRLRVSIGKQGGQLLDAPASSHELEIQP